MADLNFYDITSCDAITFDTPTTGLQYIEYILGSVVKDFSNVDKYTITASINCCTATPINIRPLYQFNPVISACLSNVGGSGPQGTYTIRIDGIHGDLVSALLLGIDGGALSSYTYTNTSGVLTIDLPIVDTKASTTVSIQITTVSNFTYIIDFDITQDPNPAVSCDGTISNISITYPSLPSNIIEVNNAVAASITQTPSIGLTFTITADNKGIVGNGITITPDGVKDMSTLVSDWNTANPSNTVTLTGNSGAYVPSILEGPYVLAGGIAYTWQRLSLNDIHNVTTLQSGVYEIIFCEVLYDTSSVCIQNHVFVECGEVKCQTVNKLVQCVDSNIMDYYNALIWANDCTTTVTFTEMCALYEILTILIQTDGCYGRLDECNCSDASTIANKLNPIIYPNTTTNNPCSSC